MTPMIAVTGAGGPSGTDLTVTVSAPLSVLCDGKCHPGTQKNCDARSRTVMRHE